MEARTGSDIIADELKANGVDLVYHVPGESFLPALDSFSTRHPDIRCISCRHENGAAQMAEAYGKLTGRPGIAFVTRSPGATNAVNAVHTAFQDSSPMILFVGQVKRSLMEREAFMSYDFRTLFAPLTKWVAQIDDPRRIPEFIQRAFHTAMTGRMGPVVLVVPEDVFEEHCETAPSRPYERVRAGVPAAQDLGRIAGMIAAAEKPVLVVGGSGWTEATRDAVQAFSRTQAIPVVTTFRRRDIIDHAFEHYAGEIGIGSNPRLLEHIKQSDLVIMCNDALSDVNTIGAGYMEGFTLFSIPTPRQQLIHVTGSFGDLNRVFQASLALVADNDAFAAALGAMAPIQPERFRPWSSALRATFEAERAPQPCPGSLDIPSIMTWLRRRLPDDAIVTNGVGAYATWSQRYFSHSKLHTQLGPISGSMGYSLPAAISAKLLHPGRTVVCFVGDGCYQMSAEELATAVQYKANVVIVLFNNSLYGTIRIHEENRLQGRTHGTELVNPDFALLAKAYGAHGEKVASTEEFEPAFERALAAGKPALIELIVDRDVIHTRYTLSDLRRRRLAASSSSAG
ncbi:thiamine pyrophosphate-binding protein [Labrys monachus]|uniref:Acetolactate synthase-1/2/3 large subunit n=1 Tax=Labrys monachus TaxID=217067 RepID=A0ABU0FH16_9HYPH|nr:thiamine pyrophosphate-binding protein [Labrys monachus]MDQ0393632.1 acetolactate synthase-1/2/3 large subunit [Labrys monachus]